MSRSQNSMPVIVLSALLLFALTQTVGVQSIVVRTADEFLDSCCINTHFNYPSYQNAGSTLKKMLLDSGFRTVRDDIGISNITALGLKTIWVVSAAQTETRSGLLSQLQSVADAVSNGGMLDAIEGPNEANGYWPGAGVTYQGNAYPQGLYQMIQDIWTTVKNSSVLQNVPVLGPGWSQAAPPFNYTIQDFVDYGNFHPYPTINCYVVPWTYDNMSNYYCQNNDPINTIGVDYSTDAFVYVAYSATTGNKTMSQSETGYSTYSQGTSVISAGKYMPRLLVEGFRMGYFRTCIYELFDEANDPGTSGNNLGLIFNNLTAKPAYNAVKTLLNLLNDTGSPFTPTQIDCNVTVTPVDTYTETSFVHYLLLQKTTGVYYFLIWHEIALEDVSQTPFRDIGNIPGLPTEVSFGIVLSSATIYTFDDQGIVSNVSANLTASNTTLSIQALPSVTIIEIIPFNLSLTTSGSTAQVSATTSTTDTTTSTATTTASYVVTSSSANTPLGLIIGVCVGGAGLIIIMAAIGLALWKRKKRRQKMDRDDSGEKTVVLSTPLSTYMSQHDVYQPIAASAAIVSKPYSNTGSPVLSSDRSWVLPYSELELEQEVGSGAFGIVHKATWRRTPVAVKVMNRSKMSAKDLEEFQFEAELMRKLRPHPNVVLLLGVCHDPVALVTEFVENGSLWSALRGKPLNKETIMKIVIGIGRGVNHLHIENIIHRDISARNVLLTSTYDAKISDFGMSRFNNEQQGNSTVTETGPLKWMAPECLRDRVYSFASDAWAFGVTLVEIYTRDVPYPDLDGIKVATRVSTGELIPQIPKEAPARVAQVMQMCFAFKPEERPSFQEICQQIERQ